MFDRVGKCLAQLVACVAGLLLLGTVASDALAILFRYGLDQPLVWTEEVQRYLMIWVAFLGGAACVGTGDHMAIDLFGSWLPPWAQQARHILLLAATAVFCGVLICKGIPLALGVHDQLAPATGIPMTYPYLAVGIGGSLMLCASLLRIGAAVAELKLLRKAR